MTLPYSRDDLLANVRRAFPNYYAHATAHDMGLLDGLVLAHAGLVVGMNAPRTGVPAALRADLEQKTNHAEMIFTELRERVRASATFTSRPEHERNEIERTLFAVRVPSDT